MAKARLERLATPRLQKGGRQPQNFTGSTVLEKLDTYNLILRLGQLRAYDSSRRIRGPDGGYVQNTDIAHLIEEAMRPSRVVNGADEFIDLLVSCKIDPEIIVNDTLRSKLVKRMEQINARNASVNDDDSPDGGSDDTVIYDLGTPAADQSHRRTPSSTPGSLQGGRGVENIRKKIRLQRIEGFKNKLKQTKGPANVNKSSTHTEDKNTTTKKQKNHE